MKIVIIGFFSVAGGPLGGRGPGASAPCAPLLIRPWVGLIHESFEDCDSPSQQILEIVTEEMDKVSLLKILRQNQSKPITRCILHAAKSAKREKRHRERISSKV